MPPKSRQQKQKQRQKQKQSQKVVVNIGSVPRSRQPRKAPAESRPPPRPYGFPSMPVNVQSYFSPPAGYIQAPVQAPIQALAQAPVRAPVQAPAQAPDADMVRAQRIATLQPEPVPQKSAPSPPPSFIPFQGTPYTPQDMGRVIRGEPQFIPPPVMSVPSDNGEEVLGWPAVFHPSGRPVKLLSPPLDELDRLAYEPTPNMTKKQIQQTERDILDEAIAESLANFSASASQPSELMTSRLSLKRDGAKRFAQIPADRARILDESSPPPNPRTEKIYRDASGTPYAVRKK